MRPLMIILSAMILPLLTACGGDEPDYESCVTINGKTTCCSTYCEGNKCETYCY